MSKPKRTDPTPQEIAAEAARIRAEWPEHRWRKEEPGCLLYTSDAADE